VWKTRWLTLYEPGTPSRKLLENVINTYFLVNIVDNNYISGDIFEVFFQAVREPASPTLSQSNGSITNGGC